MRNLISAVTGLLVLVVYACSSPANNIKEPETPQITNKYWKLIEIKGQTVEASDGWIKEPHLLFDSSETQMTGNGGCNSFFSNYTLDTNQSLSFGPIGITEMACPDMDLEQQFTRTLRLVEAYSIHNDTLILSGTSDPELAILAWVKNK